MIVLVDGVYEEEYNPLAGALNGSGGIGGMIGGKFIGFSIGGPPCERRELTHGVSSAVDGSSAGGFGWVDFLGVGSERAVGSKMRRVEQRLLGRRPSGTEGEGRGRMIIMAEVNLDQPRTLEALKTILSTYDAEPEPSAPMAFVLMGNFVQHALIGRGGNAGSIEYKECFDALASTLSEFPSLLRSATFVFVPGDNDPWASAFSLGAATPLPRKGVPDLFTSRIKRVFAAAANDADKNTSKKPAGEAVWTSNPARLSLFGPSHEIVLFRDDIQARFRRTAINFKPPPATANIDVEMDDGSDATVAEPALDAAVQAAESQEPQASAAAAAPMTDVVAARKLVKTILDQSHLSPFPLAKRPLLWDHAAALQLYPLPTALVLADSEMAPFVVTYEGCCVMNPSALVEGRGRCRWVEYDFVGRRGKVKEGMF
jgi:DNA polymerase epsilon subunit 2